MKLSFSRKTTAPLEGAYRNPQCLFVDSVSVCKPRTFEDTMSDDDPKPTEKKPCESCGQVHEDSPFTGEMFEMFEEFKDPETPEERRFEILLEVSRLMVERPSAIDLNMPEPWHALLQEVIDTHSKWQAMALRLGRTVLRELARASSDDGYAHLREALKVGKVMVFTPDGPSTPPDPKDGKKPMN